MLELSEETQKALADLIKDGPFAKTITVHPEEGETAEVAILKLMLELAKQLPPDPGTTQRIGGTAYIENPTDLEMLCDLLKISLDLRFNPEKYKKTDPYDLDEGLVSRTIEDWEVYLAQKYHRTAPHNWD